LSPWTSDIFGALAAALPAASALDWEPAWDGTLSALLLAVVFLLVAALFRHGGQIRMSPQRAAAIATGHMDRRTVFERPWLRPLLWLLLTVAHRLDLPRAKAWIARQLEGTGNPNYYTPQEYLALSFLSGLVLVGVLELFNWLLYAELSLVWLVVGLVFGAGLPLLQLYTQASRRLRQIWKRLPYALDLIALAMGAGATFTEAVRTIVGEDTDDPFHVELRTLLAEMDLGATRRRALENLAARVPLEELRSIVASVIQSEELGTPLTDVLHDQATLLRNQRSVRAEEAAAKASVRILVPCLLLVIAVMLAVFGPAIVRFVRGGLFG